MRNRPLILISNDDGVYAQGIEVLTELMCTLGDVIVVAPNAARSGAACSITSSNPVRLTLVRESEGLKVYTCSGTPVDCVKLALEKVLTREPDLVVSGINHGDNASVSIHYSGTIGAVLEACMKGLPAIGFSLRTCQKECDFSPYKEVILRVTRYVLQYGLQKEVCLNVNFPQVAELQGVNVCRMAKGNWVQEWKNSEMAGEYFLTGYFVNLEPDAEDTDCWAIDHGMAAVTPLQLDATHYPSLAQIKEKL